MDIFQLIGDFLHLIAVLMLLLKIVANKNVIGRSTAIQVFPTGRNRHFWWCSWLDTSTSFSAGKRSTYSSWRSSSFLSLPTPSIWWNSKSHTTSVSTANRTRSLTTTCTELRCSPPSSPINRSTRSTFYGLSASGSNHWPFCPSSSWLTSWRTSRISTPTTCCSWACTEAFTSSTGKGWTI